MKPKAATTPRPYESAIIYGFGLIQIFFTQSISEGFFYILVEDSSFDTIVDFSLEFSEVLSLDSFDTSVDPSVELSLDFSVDPSSVDSYLESFEDSSLLPSFTPFVKIYTT